MPGLETVYVDRCLPLYQRWPPFHVHRHEERRLARPILGVGRREPIYHRFRLRFVFFVFFVFLAFFHFKGREELHGGKERKEGKEGMKG